MKKITKEQVREYIDENYNEFFVDALTKYVKEVIFDESASLDDRSEYRKEVKDLIYDGVKHGTLEYLEKNGDSYMRTVAEELFKGILNKKKILVECLQEIIDDPSW